MKKVFGKLPSGETAHLYTITSGTIIVGAFKTCGSVVAHGGVSVEAVNTNEDDFVKNLMTIRAEERLALAVRRPAGFKKLTKASGT